jgi:hypothetical protein
MAARWCNFCPKIPFDKLPSEEEDALPHQPSLNALSESTEYCPMCRLIFWAAGCTLASQGGMMSNDNMLLPSGRKVNTTTYGSNLNVFGLFRAMENGAMVSSAGNDEPDLRDPECINPQEEFSNRSDIRPWLFGNWWKSPLSGEPTQLIGLGVRLGTGPSVEEAVGNTNEEVIFRGSYIRIRTDNGKASSRSKFGIGVPDSLFRCVHCVCGSGEIAIGGFGFTNSFPNPTGLATVLRSRASLRP